MRGRVKTEMSECFEGKGGELGIQVSRKELSSKKRLKVPEGEVVDGFMLTFHKSKRRVSNVYNAHSTRNAKAQ